MAEEDNAEDPAQRSGEFIRVGEAPAPVVPVETGTIGWLLTRLSRWPFRNRRYVKAMETAKDVLRTRTELGKTYIEHEEIVGQVHDLPITVGKQRFQRLREYFEEERRLTTEVNDAVVEGKTRDKKNTLKLGEVEIQEMEQEKRKLRAKKELEELNKPAPVPPPPPGPSEKQKLREQAFARRDAAIKRIEAKKNATPQTKKELKKAAENELEKELQRIQEMP